MINISSAKHNGTSYVTWLRSNPFKISATEAICTVICMMKYHVHSRSFSFSLWYAFQKQILLIKMTRSRFKIREHHHLNNIYFRLSELLSRVLIKKKNNPSSYYSSVCLSTMRKRESLHRMGGGNILKINFATVIRNKLKIVFTIS